MKLLPFKNSVILGASVLAVLALVVFQMSWIRYSGKLSEEIFNQRASMALCAALDKYEISCADATAGCCQLQCCAAENIVVQDTFAGDSLLKANLRQALDRYQIGLDFQLSLSKQKISNCIDGFQCAVSMPAENGVNTFVNLSFPDKKQFVWGKIGFMMIATILILLFITAVLLMANWSLAKQKQLLQTNVDFFNNMAHEFRTPLTNIGLAGNMLARKHPDLQGDAALQIIKSENTKLLNQVERVLQLASIEHDGYVFQQENIPLQEMLQSVRDEMAMQIEDRQASFSLDIPAQLALYGDRLHLSNVFRNLLDNALKYNQNRPEIRCTAAAQGKGVLITIQDNGTGIPADQADLIFQKFQRIGNGDQHDQKGFGLGLAYVKSVVERHHGYVRVSSTPGQGSQFEVYLPSQPAKA